MPQFLEQIFDHFPVLTEFNIFNYLDTLFPLNQTLNTDQPFYNYYSLTKRNREYKNSFAFRRAEEDKNEKSIFRYFLQKTQTDHMKT